MQAERLWCVLSVAVLLVLTLSVSALAAANGSWSQPLNLSGWQGSMEVHRLERGADGTLAAYYPVFDLTSTDSRLWARVRPAGGDWTPAIDVSGVVTPSGLWWPTYWGAGVGPDGTAWAAWTTIDSGQAGDNRQVRAARRQSAGSWQWEPLSNYETEIRSTDFHMGPEGHMAVAWVACTSDINTPAQGPCAVNVRQRFPNESSWRGIVRLDDSTGEGIMRAHVLVGPGGLTVVQWIEAKPGDTSQWMVRAKAWNPETGVWDAAVEDLSDVWIVPKNDESIVQPVMGPDGLFVTAWTALINPASSLVAQYSVTRSPAGVWSGPVQISGVTTDKLFEPSLGLRGGVTVAAWERQDAAGKEALFANARDPNGTWGAEAQLTSTYWEDAGLLDLQQWPDGTAVATWNVFDNGRPASEDSAVFWKARSPHGAWGGGGQGQLGSWVSGILRGALALSDDGSGASLWAITDLDKPVLQQGTLLVASWLPAGPGWSQPQPLHENQLFAAISPRGVVAGSGDHPAAATWFAIESVPANPQSAIFFSEVGAGGYEVFLPVVLRNR